MYDLIAALLVTARMWCLSEVGNIYRHWPRKSQEHKNGFDPDSHDIPFRSLVKRPAFGVGKRVAMIVWLRRRAKASWMRNTGALWKILLNSSGPMTVVLKLGGCSEQTSAGDLVSRYHFGYLEGVEFRKCTPANSKRRDSLESDL